MLHFFKIVTESSKFGIIESDLEKVIEILQQCASIQIIGLHCHLGSTIKDISGKKCTKPFLCVLFLKV